MKNRLDLIMNKVAALVSDLDSPAQNPAYCEPSKEEIVDVLKEVLSVHGLIETLYDESLSHGEYKEDMDRTFENVEELINDAVRYLDHALDDIRNR